MTTAQAFDEWLRQYEADPSAFMATFQSVDALRKGAKRGEKATEYGISCAAFLAKLKRQRVPAKKKAKR